MIKTSKKMKMLIFLLLIFGVIFGMLKAPKVLAENLNPPPSYGADNGSRFYAYDKGRRLQPVFQTAPGQETDYWAFCLDWNRDIPNYNPATGEHDGEFTLIVNPNLQQFREGLATPHGGSTARPRGDVADVYDKVKKLMYIYAKDPTNIQARHNINSWTFWAIVSNAIYYYTNSIPVTTYVGSNAVLNAPRNEVYKLLDDNAYTDSNGIRQPLIPEDTEVEFRMYKADWRTGRGIQSLASLRISEPKEVKISKRNIAGNEIPGATLRILKDGQEVAKWVSEANKTHTLKLKPGRYTFNEESAPAGYSRVLDINFEVDGSGNIQVLTDPSGATSVSDAEKNKLIVTDKSLPEIEFIKRNTDGADLAGAELKLLKDGQEVAHWTSVAGQPYKIQLQPGQYVFHEMKAPKGYNEVPDITFEVTEDGVISITKDPSNSANTEDKKLIVTDEKTPIKKIRFLVDKFDESDTRLANGRFYLYHVGRDGLEEVNKTNTNTSNPAPLQSGDIELKPIEGHDYDEFVIRETVAPNGYLRLPIDIHIRVALSDGSITVVNASDFITNNLGQTGLPLVTHKTREDQGVQELTLSIKNVKETSMKIKKVDSVAKSPLQGAKFALADSEENAKAGKFLKQVNREETYVGHRTYIVNEDDPIYIDASDSEKSDYYAVSDQNGIASFDHLDPRKTYYAVEIEAPSGYIVDETPITLTKNYAEDRTAVEVTNKKPKFRFSVTKTDEEGNPLIGRFYIYRSSNLLKYIERFNTKQDSSVDFTINPLPVEHQQYDDFTLRETVAPDGGYSRLPNDVQIRVYLDGKAEILNKDGLVGTDGQPLFSGVEIDSDGKWWLPVVKQADETNQFNITVRNVHETSMKIKKIDGDTQMPLAGAKFAIADSESNAWAGKFLKRITRSEETNLGNRAYLVNETDPLYIGLSATHKKEAEYIVTSGDDGMVTFDHLDPRKTYYAVEVESPKNYKPNRTPIALTKDNGTDETALAVTNVKTKVIFQVQKQAEDYTKIAAQFKLSRKTNGKEEELGVADTAISNPVELPEEPYVLNPVEGTDYEDFVISESIAPGGYIGLPQDIFIRVFLSGRIEVLNRDFLTQRLGKEGFPLAFAVTRVDKDRPGITVVAVDIRNVAQTKMKIKKVDATDQNRFLPGAKFAIADSLENATEGKFLKRIVQKVDRLGDITYLVNEGDPLYENLTEEEKKKAIYTVTTGADGIATFENLEEERTYYAVEVASPSGYALDKTPVALTKNNTTNETAAVKTNEQLKFQFRIRKTDEAGNSLAARFYFYRKSDLNNRIDRTNTNTNADNTVPLHNPQKDIDLIVADGQDYEDFVVRETVAPDGFIRPPADIIVRVYTDGRAEIVNSEEFFGTDANNTPLVTVTSTRLEDSGKYQISIVAKNIAETSMRIKKVDGADEKTVLAGAQFALADSLENAKAGKFLKLVKRDIEWNTSTNKAQYSWESAGSQADATIVTTGQDGLASFDHLDPRKDYYVVELKAPDGYALDNTPHKLTKETKDTPLTVQNIKRGIFPSTGGVGMIAFVVAGLSLMGFAAFSKNRYKPKH